MSENIDFDNKKQKDTCLKWLDIGPWWRLFYLVSPKNKMMAIRDILNGHLANM